MEVIGEELNVRDGPIYLQLGDRNDASNSFWYVIQDKDDDGIEVEIEEDEEEEEEEIHHRIEESSSEEIHHKNKRKQVQDDKKKKRKHRNNNIISVLDPSRTDKIRELPLPPPNSPYKAKLVVFNSRIYLFGGSGGNDPWAEHSRKVIYFDTKYPTKDWLDGPTLNVPGLTLSVAALQNSFIAFGKKKHNGEPFTEFLDYDYSLNNGKWRPFPPIPEPERSQIHDARLLAVTDTKVYIHGIGNHNRMGLSFDLQNSEWNIFDRSFHGSWSPGVVLEFCSNSYLFSFGIHGLLKSPPPIHTQQLWVYDLNNCTWLPLSVWGLPDDDTVLPDPKLNRFASTYLLQMNQRNKLALVWSKPDCTYLADAVIHCTKFTIDCITHSDYQHPIFHAKVVSYGSYWLKQQGPLYNCAAPLIGKDKDLMEE